MAEKKTIAVIASTNERATVVVKNISIANYHLLLLSKYPNQFEQLSVSLQSAHTGPEFEIVDCMKDGCWEADIIILNIPQEEEKAVGELIREVSVQKIVVSFSQGKNQFESDALQNKLKYSKIVNALAVTNTIWLHGKDENAVKEVLEILNNSKQAETVDELSNNKF
ncbi:hypothetical protein FW778_02590 [Ginsengibacter hankyongi]|uniref:Pyrroline-5-carboxylate reductase catalytic N-terminal domain-containing protein n=1 Tax=Ginsengibacter hankyongi TaxID=2607284 RepID=A0A5J5IIS9_9BACT|nr:hypothetical protein [Ginsengibacter hankyongi]KAA9040945.1 hypothetical protein FW778_02590 [Ginsengibacter hankyongi]